MALKIGSGPLILGRGGGLQIKTSNAAFDPDSIAGLALDLFAESGTDTTTNNAAVASWTDRKGSTAWTQSTGASKPLYKTSGIGGKPGVSFDGGDDGLDNSTVSIASGSLTCFLVCNPTQTDAGNHWAFDTTTGRLVLMQTGNSVASAGWYDGSFHSIAAATTGAQILEWVLTSGGNGQVFRNGTSLGTAAYTAKGVSGISRVGGGIGALNSAAWGGIMSRLLIYTGALSAGNRSTIRAALGSYYGITVS